MFFDLAQANIAILCKHGYRAESIALAVAEETGCKTQAFTQLDVAALVSFDTILLEATPGLESDLGLVREITAKYSDAKVVLLGLAESKDNVVKLAEAGASGYIAPQASFQEMISVLRLIYRGEFTCPPHITYALFSHLADLAAGGAAALPKAPILTVRERKVVELLAHNLTNKEIAARLGISEYTAKNHVQRILKKLGLHDRSQAAGSSAFAGLARRRSVLALPPGPSHKELGVF